MARFRVDASQETGEVTLLIDTECGFRPVMGWPDTDSLREFTKTLMGICSRINEKKGGPIEISDRLLKQALGNDPTLLGNDQESE